ncbi:Chromodomain helicase DNA binding protein [Phlyctochytrium bullatum]|nr:Chromodomain helicase DNA binding protein [Phlyctochytrium bullatum]
MRNTYEREMFDRASLKLGLDRAILQRMDAQAAYGGDESSDTTKVSSLSKTEIEELLKKGAYVKQCLKSKSVEPDVEVDVKACLALDGVEDVEATSYDTPYPGATPKQVRMYTIREKINPVPDIKMPFIQGAPPAPWWGPDEDRDLLIGTLRHGYQQYEKIAADPTLSFAAKLGFPSESEVMGGVKAENDNAHGEDSGERPQDNAGLLNDASSDAGNVTLDAQEPLDTKSLTVKDEDADMDDDVQDGLDALNNAEENPGTEVPEDGFVLNQFPTASECGARIRKIINAFLRNQALALKDEQRRQLLEERARAKQEKEDEKVKLKERELTKKDRLEEYYLRLHSICTEIVSSDFMDPEKDYDSMTPDKAKKLLKRVASMKTLREQVLVHPKKYLEYLESKGVDPATQVRVDEGFWMKEAVAMKRFNSLCDSVLNPVVRRGVGGGSKRRRGANQSGSDVENVAVKTSSKTRSRSQLLVTSEKVTEEDLSKRKRLDRGEKKKRKRDRDSNEEAELLALNAPVKKKKKHKRKHSHKDLDQEMPDAPPAESLAGPDEGQPLNPETAEYQDPSAVVKKKKKHKKSSKSEHGTGDGVKKKKSKSKKRHHREMAEAM